MKELLNIPNALKTLLENGFWPQNSTEAVRQNLKCLVEKRLIHRIASDEEDIYFLPPPFYTVKEVMVSESTFWAHPQSAVHEIDPELTLLIGDFGLGSDALLALDYRHSSLEPKVIRLQWSRSGNHWVEVAQNFDAFVTMLEIKQ